MATNSKMTAYQFFAQAQEGQMTPDMQEYAKAEVAKILADREKAAEKRAEKAKVNDPLKAQVMEFLSVAPNFASAVGVNIGVSTSKASYLLRDLEADGFLTSEMAKAPGAKSKSKQYTVVPGKVFEYEEAEAEAEAEGEDEDEGEDE